MNRKKVSPLPSQEGDPAGHGPWALGQQVVIFVKKAAFSQQAYPTPRWTWPCSWTHSSQVTPWPGFPCLRTSCFVSLCGSHPAGWQESVQLPICKCPGVRPALPGTHPKPRKSQPPCAHILSQHLLSSVIKDGRISSLGKSRPSHQARICPTVTSGTVPSEHSNPRGWEDVSLQ